MNDLIETTLFVCPLVYIYSIPPLRSISAGHIASQWPVDNPLWQGRLRVVEVEGDAGGTGASRTVSNKVECQLKFDNPSTGELFAVAPYSADGNGIVAASDSSRFFAVTVVDGSRRAVLGMGFPDRNSSFEFNIALQDFKRHSTPKNVGNSSTPSSNSPSTIQSKDYSLKEGQTIHINIPGSSSSTTIDSTTSADAASSLSTLLPPPPPPPSRRSRTTRQSPSPQPDSEDDFGDFQ